MPPLGHFQLKADPDSGATAGRSVRTVAVTRSVVTVLWARTGLLAQSSIALKRAVIENVFFMLRTLVTPP